MAFVSPHESNRTAPEWLVSHHHDAMPPREFDQLNLGEISAVPQFSVLPNS